MLSERVSWSHRCSEVLASGGRPAGRFQALALSSGNAAVTGLGVGSPVFILSVPLVNWLTLIGKSFHPSESISSSEIDSACVVRFQGMGVHKMLCEQ